MNKSKSRKKYNDLFMTQAVEMAALLGNIPGVAQAQTEKVPVRAGAMRSYAGF